MFIYIVTGLPAVIVVISGSVTQLDGYGTPTL